MYFSYSTNESYYLARVLFSCRSVEQEVQDDGSSHRREPK